MKSCFRNVFKIEDEERQWRQVLDQFPNKVPRFETKDAALKFTKDHCMTGSNPDNVHLQQSVTTLYDRDQIDRHLIPKIKEYYYLTKKLDSEFLEQNTPNMFANRSSSDSNTNHYGIYDYLESRLNLSIHKNLSYQSTLNTLNYMFNHMKCGIFVMIRNCEVVIFCPFVNKDYKNSWGDALKVASSDGTVESYYDEKAETCRKENYLRDTSQWWANGNIICNEYKTDDDTNQLWGDHFLLQLKDMFAETCRCRAVPDCEFFVNKRDYPHLKFNPDIAGGIPVEPYGFIFDRDDRDPAQDLPLPSEQHFTSYAPILSFYTSSRFADIPIPPSEDWEAAVGQVFPASFKHDIINGEVTVAPPRDLFTPGNLAKFECAWGEKVNTAFFRGTATGGGVDAITNQRLHLAQISYDWSSQKRFNGSQSSAPFLDAKITGWNMRDKKIATEPMTFLQKSNFAFKGDRASNFVEIYKQATYKYLLYVEGHCAACRYGFMMRLGSVILKVESQCVADQMWYFPLLRPYEDHVPVKADLSDLLEVLQWCHDHDAECEKIAARAQELYHRFVSREGILDYLQVVCQGIAERTHRPPSWARDTPQERPVPKLPANMIGSSESRFCCELENNIDVRCLYCDAARKRDAFLTRQRSAQLYNQQFNSVDVSSGKGPKVLVQTEEELKKRRKDELKERRKRLAEEDKSKRVKLETAVAGGEVEKG